MYTKVLTTITKISVLILVVAINADGKTSHKPRNHFFAKWTPMPTDWEYPKLPRTVAEATGRDFGYVARDPVPCATGQFRGRRYGPPNDMTLTVLFDAHNNVAGLQKSVPVDVFTTLYDTWANHFFLRDFDGSHWTQTVYFVNPKKICGWPNYERDDGFYIQKGKNPESDLMRIPETIPDAMNTKWDNGKCFPTMGVHKSFQVTENMDCKRYVPITAMFNNDELTGFVMIQNVRPRSTEWPQGYASDWNDFPPSNRSNYGNTQNPVPRCFGTDGSWEEISTTHVYFNQDPFRKSVCDSNNPQWPYWLPEPQAGKPWPPPQRNH